MSGGLLMSTTRQTSQLQDGMLWLIILLSYSSIAWMN